MANKIDRDSLINCIDTVFVAAGEMIPDNGEDSYAYSFNDKFGCIAVFDGCGGIGSRKYEAFDNKTGAYIASHAVSKAMLEWFEKFSQSNASVTEKNADLMSEELYNTFTETLKSIENETTATLIRGSLTKSFPTTASAIVFRHKNDKMQAAYLWAGDSRGYLLTGSGLKQLTTDDVEGEEDALSNLTSDARLSNVVSATGDYKINNKVLNCPRSGIFISATDGCFGYFKTPMEFEYMLINTMLKSESVEEWETKLGEYMRSYAGDDYTLAVAVYGYRNFRMVKRSYETREKILYNKYISQLAGASEERLIELWDEYKEGYYING